MVSNKDRVGGKIVFEIIGVWTCLLETLEYLCTIEKVFSFFLIVSRQDRIQSFIQADMHPVQQLTECMACVRDGQGFARDGAR